MISVKSSKTSTWKTISTNLTVSCIVSVLIYANLSMSSPILPIRSKLLENKSHRKPLCFFPKCPTVDSSKPLFLLTSITKCSLFGNVY